MSSNSRLVRSGAAMSRVVITLCNKRRLNRSGGYTWITFSWSGDSSGPYSGISALGGCPQLAEEGHGLAFGKRLEEIKSLEGVFPGPELCAQVDGLLS